MITKNNSGKISFRTLETSDENHHLWNNNGIWNLNYTSHPTPMTKQRVRISLATRSIVEARKLRDLFFAEAGVIIPEKKCAESQMLSTL